MSPSSSVDDRPSAGESGGERFFSDARHDTIHPLARPQITAVAEPMFRFLKVKPEFLPEVAPKPYYGRIGY